MINPDIIRQFALYQRRLTKNPEHISYYFNLPESPYIYQYHSAKGKIFGAVFAKNPNGCHDFRAYIQKVELN